ncbi:signal peptidase I [Anaeroselena agilis]|uniref:Signal peptidase I n=1 Tax=Anaeroselena agilis TaxID=3063788 RepID=A0ABU3NYR0_9FIRM|nr:signal peptidase I [Selenomonadales bacterium 4137-cl]
MSSFMREAGEWLQSIVLAAAIALVINVFFFQPTKVLGHSMEPTFHEGQRIYLSKVVHTLGRLPGYGDIVVIDSRVDRPRKFADDLAEPVSNVATLVRGGSPSGHYIWVKRVVGLPGDVLEFKGGKVYRNGKALTENYVKEPMRYSSPGKVTVPPGHVFVMGDNRNNSSDSRFIGSIPADHILGVMLF